MKAYETPRSILGLIIFLGSVLFLSLFFYSNFTKFSGSIETPIEEIEAYEAAYSVRTCLAEHGTINVSRLSKMKGNINEICNIPYPPIQVQIKDLETGKIWEFDMPDIVKLKKVFYWLKDEFSIWEKKKKVTTHEISVPLEYSLTLFKKDDIIMLSGNLYYIFIRRNGEGAFVNIRKIYYKKSADVMNILDKKTLSMLKDKLNEAYEKNGYTGFYVYPYINIRAKDVAFIPISDNASTCRNKKNICFVKDKEVHAGRLYVKV